jgi:cell wall-associated NlpC family hydrolase
MNRRRWAYLVAAALAVGLVAAAPTAARAPSSAAPPVGAEGSIPADDNGPAAAATAYLQARAAALTTSDPAAALAPWTVAGSELAATEAAVARGATLRGKARGRSITGATCKVTILDSQPADDGLTATVAAHAITMVTWQAANGKSDTEGSGVEHTLTLQRSGDSWVVVGDAYSDVRTPADLEAAGASGLQVRAAARALERAAQPITPPRATRAKSMTRRRAPSGRRYRAIITYDRADAQAYADARALNYNPNYVRFNHADCANFASQCARAGDMPMAGSTYNSGWWYDRKGTSSPSNDTYSFSWINCVPQMNYWNGRRTDWVTSVGRLSRGDFIYYDWTGNGVWDHVAVVAGTNSSGQKVIDAHTTDLYRAFWKLGSSSTKYRFARVRPQWVIL